MGDNESDGEWSPWGDEGDEDQEEGEGDAGAEEPLLHSPSHQQERQSLQGSGRAMMTDDDDGRLSVLLLDARPSRATQYIAAFSATMGALAMGVVLGFSSPAGTMLTTNSTSKSSIHLTTDQNTWFSSSVNLGALAGGPVGGLLINVIGRRGTMMASTIPFIGGWLLIVLAHNFAMLVSGRVVTGLCIGVTSLVVPTYIGEYASPDVRGTLGSGFQLMVTIGVVYSYGVGALVTSWRMLAGICIIPVGVYFILMAFMKESPIYLLGKGKEQEGKAALQHFRGRSHNIQTELDMMREAVQEAKSRRFSFKVFRKPHVFKPFLISLSLMFFQQFSGVNAVLFNLGSIFVDSGSSLSNAVSALVVGLVQVVATLVAAGLMDRAGRKILLIISASVMTLSLVALGSFFYVKQTDPEWAMNTLGWLPLLSLILFISSFSIGYGPIPWLMMGELFSADVKEVAASLATMFNWTLSFVVTSIFFPMQTSIGIHGAYWLFSGLCLVNLIFCVLIVPETKGKTLEEITAMFGDPAAGMTVNRRSQSSEA